MALIECPECGREVSSSAAVCPECAYPVGAGTPAVPPRAMSGSTKRPWWRTAISISNRLTIGAFLAGIGGTGEESAAAVAAVIGGLIIGASAIPVFYRDRVERLRAGWADPAPVDGLDDRMAEMEHRHRQQMVELEERVDFAERLLTKQREQIGPG